MHALGVRWSFRGKDAGSVRTWKVRARLRTQHPGEQRGPEPRRWFVKVFWLAGVQEAVVDTELLRLPRDRIEGRNP